MNHSELQKLQSFHKATKDLIALAEKKTIEADPDGRTMAELEHDGDLPKPIMDARVQLAIMGRMIEEGAEPSRTADQIATQSAIAIARAARRNA